MQQASRFLGDNLYKKLRQEFRTCINSYRAEKSSGSSGLKKAATELWQLRDLEKKEGAEAVQERLAELLKGEYETRTKGSKSCVRVVALIHDQCEALGAGLGP